MRRPFVPVVPVGYSPAAPAAPQNMSSVAPTVSVALCTWQGERHVAAQLRSIAAQSVLPTQVVVVDDASADGTWAVLLHEAEALRAAGIEVVLRQQEQNVGYVRNFETALSACSGDIVFLCDQDDVWHADKVATFLQAFAARPTVQLLHSDARLVDAQGRPLPATLFQALSISRRDLDREHRGEGFELLMGRNLVTGAVTALRRGLITQALPVAKGWIHDEWLALVAAASGGLDSIEAITTDYRQHGDNQVGARQRGLLERAVGSGSARRTYLAAALARLRSLQEQARLGRPALDAAQLATLDQRLRHAEARACAPARLPSRMLHIARELGSGRYHRFSNGLRSAASDLVQGIQ